jgi:hypothetical protein
MHTVVSLFDINAGVVSDVAKRKKKGKDQRKQEEMTTKKETLQ